MASENINKNIERNYLKAIKFDDKAVEAFKDTYGKPAEPLVDMIAQQNYAVLVESSKIYESFIETKERAQEELLKLDSLMDEISDLKGVFVSQSQGGSGNPLNLTMVEFEKKIEELEKQIKGCDEKIDTEKKNLVIMVDKIKDAKEYLLKFSLEKRLYLDKVNEIELRDQTYGDGFPQLYQAKVMKMIFESILLDKVQEDINNAKVNIKFDVNDKKYEIELEKITSRITFEWFKKNCFNSWKFKNLILAAEEYVIHEFQRENSELPTLEKISTDLVKLKEEAEKIRDEYAESIYWPLINAVLVTVYTSIAKRKLETYEDNQTKINVYIKKLEAEKNESNGKISVLKEVKNRIDKSVSVSSENMFDKLKKGAELVRDVVLDAKDSKERSQEFEDKKSSIIDEISKVVESLKAIEYSQENNFQTYLKELGNILIAPKMINKK